MASADFSVDGSSTTALFTLRLYRGESMVLLAMNWRTGEPPPDFVGFAIEYKEPDGDRFFPLRNRLSFKDTSGQLNPNTLSTRLSPIQKFRWVHFPRRAELAGVFTYRVSPVFMNQAGELSYGDPQEAGIRLGLNTYSDRLNVAFTRGFVSSQAFIDHYDLSDTMHELMPARADEGLTFQPTYPRAQEALAWMGFEARSAILRLLDAALADTTAQVSVLAYDLNEPEVVSRLQKLGNRLRIIIDNSGEHSHHDSAETQAAQMLTASAGATQVKRQHMLGLQHNKVIIVAGKNPAVACGSTNFSWRAFYVQANNAVIMQGDGPVKAFSAAFEGYWQHPDQDFRPTASASWHELDLKDIQARVTFSPHAADNAQLESIATDLRDNTNSSLFFSLAFLYQTEGPIKQSIAQLLGNDQVFVYGMSDRKTGGLDFQKPNGEVAPVYPAALSKDLPPPFHEEPTGGSGVRMHHKFLVMDFDQPTARVYFGSYNFSNAADTHNGENLLLIQDRKVAVAYMVEALRLFDHYHFRVAQSEAKRVGQRELFLKNPPRSSDEKPWWFEYYSDPRKIRDRKLFGIPADA